MVAGAVPSCQPTRHVSVPSVSHSFVRVCGGWVRLLLLASRRNKKKPPLLCAWRGDPAETQWLQQQATHIERGQSTPCMHQSTHECTEDALLLPLRACQWRVEGQRLMTSEGVSLCGGDEPSGRGSMASMVTPGERLDLRPTLTRTLCSGDLQSALLCHTGGDD